MRRTVITVALVALGACGGQAARTINTHGREISRRTAQTSTAWADLVAPHLPAGATLVALPAPASTVMAANPSATLLVYRLPSGRYLDTEREKGTVDPQHAHVIPGKDTDSTTAAGSRRYVITHNAAWTQVILQRPNGTMLNLEIDSDPRVTFTQPPELDKNGLVAMSDSLDNTNSDLP